MTIKWIKQEDPSGCVLACLAMITGQTYQEVKGEFIERDWMSEAGGVPGSIAGPAYLAEYGYAFAPKHADSYPFLRKRAKWPVDPFADIHWCTVVTSRSHAVLMIRDGTVLDPNCEKPKRLSDYVRVDMIAGVVPFHNL